MPTARIRNGNALIERASFSKTHGATPTQAEMSFTAVAAATIGARIALDIGGSTWCGNIVEVVTEKNEGVGQITRVKAHDTREVLMSQSVFAMLNMLDRKTGQVFCILDDAFLTALNNLGYISGQQLGQESGRWQMLKQFRVWDFIYPQTVIEVLLNMVGFTKPIYSTEAKAVLNNAAGQSWLSSKNNIYGLDWSMGNKVGAALTQICELLGLQFTLDSGSLGLTLKFTKIGERSYQGIEWAGIYAPESTQGQALQTDVDTGVWIMGERDVWELQKVDLVPAWNQLWNRWALKGEQFVQQYFLSPLGLDLFTTKINDLSFLGECPEFKFSYAKSDNTDGWQKTAVDLSTLYDPGFTANGFFGDMTIHEYLSKVPYYVYRIAIMDQFLSPAEFYGYQVALDSDGNAKLDNQGRPIAVDANGSPLKYGVGGRIRVSVRYKPICFPLLSDPSTPYHCDTNFVWKHSKRHRIKVTPARTRREKGHHLSEETGHIAFDSRLILVTKAGQDYSEANQGMLNPDMPTKGDTYDNPTNIIPDVPQVNVCFYGPIFKKFFGADYPSIDPATGLTLVPRIGSKKISGLRRGKLLTNAAMSNPTDEGTTPWGNDDLPGYMESQSEFLLNPTVEKKAEDEAKDVATSWLNRPHTVKSGEERFVATAGHEPDGEIRRVSVSVDAQQGVHESVSYANDWPSLFHEPDIELSRRISMDAAIRKGDQLKRDQLFKLAQEANTADAAVQIGDGHGPEVAAANRVRESHIEVGLVEAVSVLRGEPVLGKSRGVTGKPGDEFVTVKSTDPIVDADPRVVGIALVAEGAGTTKPDEDGNYGRLRVATHGPIPALVMGPCNQGDSLCLAADPTKDVPNWATKGKYLKAGPGNIYAMEPVAAGSDSVMAWVSLGVPTSTKLLTITSIQTVDMCDKDAAAAAATAAQDTATAADAAATAAEAAHAPNAAALRAIANAADAEATATANRSTAVATAKDAWIADAAAWAEYNADPTNPTKAAAAVAADAALQAALLDPNAIAFAQIIERKLDYLICTDPNGPAGNVIYVAKPILLRITPIWYYPSPGMYQRTVAGQSYKITYAYWNYLPLGSVPPAYPNATDGQQRTAIRDSDTFGETQTISEAYQVGDQIHADPIITVPNDSRKLPPMLDPNGHSIMMQARDDGRHWVASYGE